MFGVHYVYVHIFTAQNMKLCLKWLYLFIGAFALYHNMVIKYYLLHLQMGDDMNHPHKKPCPNP